MQLGKPGDLVLMQPECRVETGRVYRSVAYGLRWESELPMPFFTSDPDDAGPADVAVVLVNRPRDRGTVQGGSGNVLLFEDGVRYTAGSEAVIDTYGPQCIEVSPGPGWTGCLPPGFFGTVTALLLARRGFVPLHGSAVEINGHGVLICGPSGAGKSTVAAGLIAQGARLVSDDLSMLDPRMAGSDPALLPGRRTLRLFPATAGYLEESVGLAAPPIKADAKLAVAPPCVDHSAPVPLKTLVVLSHGRNLQQDAQKEAVLIAQLFRPKRMAALPGHTLRVAALSLAARRIRVLNLAALAHLNREEFLSAFKITFDACA